eukprot:TRINITY_DN10236_c0_g1_i1.p1 TRINITY_DN10236_c0_g1~~TRINITY_DN10236_c0_g1_i1.p1  ORF type:complete len:1194 (-),score=224.56 TRINITY_DN10236_c0_g1_i1:87-3668(-)
MLGSLQLMEATTRAPVAHTPAMDATIPPPSPEPMDIAATMEEAIACGSPEPMEDMESDIPPWSPEPMEPVATFESPEPLIAAVAGGSPEPMEAGIVPQGSQEPSGDSAVIAKEAAIAHESPEPMEVAGISRSPEPIRASVAEASPKPMGDANDIAGKSKAGIVPQGSQEPSGDSAVIAKEAAIAHESPEPMEVAGISRSPEPIRASVAEASPKPMGDANDIAGMSKADTTSRGSPDPAEIAADIAKGPAMASASPEPMEDVAALGSPEPMNPVFEGGSSEPLGMGGDFAASFKADSAPCGSTDLAEIADVAKEAAIAHASPEPMEGAATPGSPGLLDAVCDGGLSEPVVGEGSEFADPFKAKKGISYDGASGTGQLADCDGLFATQSYADASVIARLAAGRLGAAGRRVPQVHSEVADTGDSCPMAFTQCYDGDSSVASGGEIPATQCYPGTGRGEGDSLDMPATQSYGVSADRTPTPPRSVFLAAKFLDVLDEDIPSATVKNEQQDIHGVIHGGQVKQESSCDEPSASAVPLGRKGSSMMPPPVPSSWNVASCDPLKGEELVDKATVVKKEVTLAEVLPPQQLLNRNSLAACGSGGSGSKVGNPPTATTRPGSAESLLVPLPELPRKSTITLALGSSSQTPCVQEKSPCAQPNADGCSASLARPPSRHWQPGQITTGYSSPKKQQEVPVFSASAVAAAVSMAGALESATKEMQAPNTAAPVAVPDHLRNARPRSPWGEDGVDSQRTPARRLRGKQPDPNSAEKTLIQLPTIEDARPKRRSASSASLSVAPVGAKPKRGRVSGCINGGASANSTADTSNSSSAGGTSNSITSTTTQAATNRLDTTIHGSSRTVEGVARGLDVGTNAGLAVHSDTVGASDKGNAADVFAAGAASSSSMPVGGVASASASSNQSSQSVHGVQCSATPIARSVALDPGSDAATTPPRKKRRSEEPPAPPSKAAARIFAASTPSFAASTPLAPTVASATAPLAPAAVPPNMPASQTCNPAVAPGGCALGESSLDTGSASSTAVATEATRAPIVGASESRAEDTSAVATSDTAGEASEWLDEVGHTLRPVEQGAIVRVLGDGWGGGKGSYRATVTEADFFTFTVVAAEDAPRPWEQTHVLRERCRLLSHAPSVGAGKHVVSTASSARCKGRESIGGARGHGRTGRTGAGRLGHSGRAGIVLQRQKTKK